MRRIYKYDLEITGQQFVEMPIANEILTIQNQTGIPRIWAIVNLDSPTTKICIEMFGTGQKLPDIDGMIGRKYLGTFQLMGGGLVYHVFKRIQI